MNNEASFAAWWQKQMVGQACPPYPSNLSELSLTAQMAMQQTAPALYTAMFAGTTEVRLPADVSVRLQSGQMQASDAQVLRSAGFEQQAQECERLSQLENSKRMDEQIAQSRVVYEQQLQRSAEWSQMSYQERLAQTPLSADQIAANRRLYGVTGE